MRRTHKHNQEPGGHPAVRRNGGAPLSVQVEYAEDVNDEAARLIIRQALAIVAEAAKRRGGGDA